MKCPKCGFTSFDYLDECKKCGVDISDVRGHLGIIAVSPDERAAASPSGMMVDDTGADGADQSAAAGGLGGATFLDENASEDTFEDTFDSLMDHSDGGTAGDLAGDQGIVLDSPLPGPKDAQAGAPTGDSAAEEGKEGDDEEFLDLDFGGIFEEEDE